MNTIIATNPSGLSTEELKQVRIKLIGIGQALYGRRICYPISDNLDLNHGRKEKGEIEGLRLSSPLKKYFVEAKDITSVDIVTTANGKTVFEFNHDANCILIDLWFCFGSRRIKVKFIAAKMFCKAFRNLTSARIVNTNKSDFLFCRVILIHFDL